MPPKLLALLVAVAIASVAGPLAADAQEKPSGDAIDVAADQVDVDVEAKTALFVGHVVLQKGALTLRCARVDVRYDHVPHVTWAKGSGGVVAELSGVKAQAPEVEIDLAGQSLELRGGVKLTRGDGWITADRATIHLVTGKVSMTGVKGSIPVTDAGSAGKPASPPASPKASP